MLQIVTGMYFKAGARRHDYTSRHVLYTNCLFLPSDPIVLPVGELAPSTGAQPVATVTVTVREQLEAERDGQDSTLIATGGDEIVDDLAVVLSFALDAVFDRSAQRVSRLIPEGHGEQARTPAAKLMHHTFDAHRVVLAGEVEDLQAFMTSLLALNRKHYVGAIRAIRRIERAIQQAAEDQTAAYRDIVAALESLSGLSSIPPAGFDAFDERKQRLINDSLAGADEQLAERVRCAVVEADRPGLRRRFIGFVMGSVKPEFFRSEAVGVPGPIRRSSLEHAVKAAYGIRSSSVHTLGELTTETQVLGQRTETSLEPDLGVVLTLDGLKRLARHVVRDFIGRAPAGVDPDFDWRDAIPGVLRMHAAPQYWVWDAEHLSQNSASRYLTGFLEHLIDLMRQPEEPIADMRNACAKIEQLVRGLADSPARTALIAIYVLWCARTPPDLHPPNAQAFLNRHGPTLDRPSMAGFAVAVLMGPHPDWSAEQWATLAQQRRDELSRRRPWPLPAGIDVALQLMAAEALFEDGRVDEAVLVAAAAVEEAPGNEELMAWEAALRGGELLTIDLRALLTGVRAEATQDEPDERAGQDEPDEGSGQDEPAGPDEAGEHRSDAPL